LVQRASTPQAAGVVTDPHGHAVPTNYKWIALSNTSLGSFMASLDASIIIVSLPAIFRGLGLDPLAPSNVSYLLWMITGYVLVTAVLVVTVGRLGDIFGRVRIYNGGFVVFTVASVALSIDPYDGGSGALWLILWRVVQAVGGSMLLANSVAILTDAFPPNQRGTALGINQVSALSGQFVGLVAGGLLSAWDWRAVFWVNVPFGVLGTVWAFKSLRETGERRAARLDIRGNVTFALGLGLLLLSITYGIQPYGGHVMGWTRPSVVAGLAAGVALLVAFTLVERVAPDPMFDLSLLRIRAFSAGGVANLFAALARGGLQFTLIIWLQGIWLPLHGIAYDDTPLWAGICMLPLTLGILVAGPVSGFLSDRIDTRLLSTTGMVVFGLSFVGLMLIPIDFNYWQLAVLIALNGIGSGMFAAPNTSSMMASVPTWQRGSASGMRQTLQNAGTSLAVGLSFTLLVSGFARSLPTALFHGLRSQGVPMTDAHRAANLPPASSIFATFLGKDPLDHLLPHDVALSAPATFRADFLPRLLSGPFHDGLVAVFVAAAILSFGGAAMCLARPRAPRAAVPPDALELIPYADGDQRIP
jgi:EmrB/QacA subfamily drug resistance transporter